jgi:1,2-diacylglycerol 3-beta-galactosyltransferase
MTTTETKNVVFAFSDTGGGHRSAALAMQAALEQAGGPAISCAMLDILRESNFPLLCNAPALYNQLSTSWLPFYNTAYALTDGFVQIEALSRLVSHVSHRAIAQALLALHPHLVVVDHALVQRLVTGVRRTASRPFGVVTVVTDLVTLHHAWIDAAVDRCCLPTDEAYALALRRGMPAEKLCCTGFPVHPRFADGRLSRANARQQLGLAPHPFTILVTSGGVGAGHLDMLVPAVEHAYPDGQILAVTGKNTRLYGLLQQQCCSPHTHLYGFVQNMDVLMAASDVVVTKAGPGTLMEALVMRRPVIITEAVGRQEEGNIDFVVNRQLGLYCPTVPQTIAAIEALQDSAYYTAIVERLADAVPGDGAARIAALLLEQLGPQAAVGWGAWQVPRAG